MTNYNHFSNGHSPNETEQLKAEKSSETNAEPPNTYFSQPSRNYRKLILRVSGGVLLLFVLFNVYAFASYVAPWNDERSQAKAEQDEIQQYISQSEKSEAALNEASNSLIRLYDHNSLTDSHINEMKLKLDKLSQQLDTDDPRLAQLESYYFAQIELVREMTEILQQDHLVEIHQKLDEVLDRQKEKSDDKAAILTTLMDQENIIYEQKADGSIAYE